MISSNKEPMVVASVKIKFILLSSNMITPTPSKAVTVISTNEVISREALQIVKSLPSARNAISLL